MPSSVCAGQVFSLQQNVEKKRTTILGQKISKKKKRKSTCSLDLCKKSQGVACQLLREIFSGKNGLSIEVDQCICDSNTEADAATSAKLKIQKQEIITIPGGCEISISGEAITPHAARKSFRCFASVSVKKSRDIELLPIEKGPGKKNNRGRSMQLHRTGWMKDTVFDFFVFDTCRKGTGEFVGHGRGFLFFYPI